MRQHERSIVGNELPPHTRPLLELLAERLDLAVGVCRLEVELVDGVVRAIWRHEKTWRPGWGGSTDEQHSPLGPGGDGDG
jgi:hypothetical protein